MSAFSSVDSAPLIAAGAALVASMIGYVGVAINAVRRLRQGKLRSISASLPGFRITWSKDDQQYEVRSLFGRISLGGPSPESSDYTARIELLTEQARSAAQELDAALKEMADAVSERRS